MDPLIPSFLIPRGAIMIFGSPRRSLQKMTSTASTWDKIRESWEFTNKMRVGWPLTGFHKWLMNGELICLLPGYMENLMVNNENILGGYQLVMGTPKRMVYKGKSHENG